MNFAVFQSLYDSIDQPLMTAINGVTGNMVGAVAGPLQTALVIYVALIGVSIFTGSVVEPLRDTWMRLGKAAAIVFFLSAGAYSTYVQNFVLNGIPADITGAITGTAGTVNANAFDVLWNKAFAAGLDVWKGLSWQDIGLEILVLVYWSAAAVAAAAGFLLWVISHIILGLFIAAGPICLPMLLFPATRSLFERWIGAVMSMLFLQFFAVMLVTVLTTAEGSVLHQIAGASDSYQGIQMLFGAIIGFVLATAILFQLPGASTALAGGMHFHAQGLARSMMRGAVTGATVGARGAAGAVQGIAAVSRPVAGLLSNQRTIPPGLSLSKVPTKAGNP